jgi:hypothetical protein
LPAPYGLLRPEGIDQLLFACALYELCGVKEMERMTFRYFAFDGVSQGYSLPKITTLLDESSFAIRAN